MMKTRIQVDSCFFLLWNMNGFNQLQRVQNPDGKFIEYTYNGNGMRTKKDFGNQATNYYYDKGNIILETDRANKAIATNIRGLRLIYRQNNPGQTNAQFLYYLHNAHGDVTQLLNDKAEVVKDYRYGTYGQDEMPEMKVFGGKQSVELWRQEVEKIDNPFRYCGEYQDEETGNYYLRARYYDPSVQRFVNEDSYGVSFGAGWKQHLYNYVGNNPITRFDPTGHVTENSTQRETPYSLRYLVSITGGSISWNPKTKTATATYYRNGRNEFYTFRQKDWYTEKGQIKLSISKFYSVIRKPGTVYSSTKGTGNDNPVIAGLKAAGKAYVKFGDGVVKWQDEHPKTMDLLMVATVFQPGGGSAGAGNKVINVTDDVIQAAMKDAPLKTQQGSISLPIVQRYVDRLLNGEKAPPIKVDQGIIVDGNHRYVAGRIAGQEPSQIDWIGGKVNKIVGWAKVHIDPVDWGNK